MKFELIEVSGMKGALLGLRLPMCKDLEEVDYKSDSRVSGGGVFEEKITVGEDDKKLCKKLINGDTTSGHGQPNSKFLRMIHAQICVTAPLYWWKEADQYKIGTTTNSTSTMHKLADTPITKECFEMENFEDVDVPLDCGANVYNFHHFWKNLIIQLEWMRQKYNETKDNRYWKELIRLLPESWLQTRMLDVDYQTLRNIYFWRKNHKLTEWHSFCDFIKTLPESWLITGEE